MNETFEWSNLIRKQLFTTALLMGSIVQGFGQIAENDFSYNIGTGFNFHVNASALDANGKLVVGGAFTSFNGTTRNYIARLNADGTLDATFSAGTALNGQVVSIALEASGNILVAGTFGGTIKRLTSTGAVASGGDTFTALAFNNVVYSIAVQPGDGKIIVVGDFTLYNNIARNRVLRLETNGNLDTTFDPSTVGLNGRVRCVAVTSGGKVLVGGSFTSPRFYYAQLNTDGTLDAAFSSGAFGSTAASSSAVYALAFQSNGQVVAGGTYFDGTSYFGATRRLNANGTSDGTFVAPEYSGSLVKALAVQTDGKIIAAGFFLQGMARYTTAGLVDPFVAGNGIVGSMGPDVNTIAVLSDGKVIAGGVFSSYNSNARNHIVRLTACPSVGFTTQPTNQGICLGSTGAFSLVATGTGLTYQWQYAINSTSLYSNIANGGVYSGATTPSLTLTSPTAGLNGYYYRCIVSDATCNSTSAPAALSVNNGQAITVDPVNANSCINTNASFAATVTGTPGGFQWQEDQGSGFVNLTNGGVYSNVTQATMNLTGVTAAMNGYKYRLQANLCTPLTSNFATLTVNEMPVINTQPVFNTGICQPNTNPINLSIAATGNTLTYQWQRYNGSNTYINLADGALAAGTFVAGGTYAGTTTAAMTITNPTANTASATDAALYRCVVSSGACAVNSNLAYVYFYATPTITTHPVNVTKCAGTNGTGVSTFSIVSPSAGGITYQWQEKVGTGSFTNLASSGVYSTVTSTTLTITGAPVGMSGNKYRCVVGTCTSPVTSNEATLTIDSPPVVTVQPGALTVCVGGNASFAVTATGSNLTYQWQEAPDGVNYGNVANGGIYDGATTATLTLVGYTISKNGARYRCVITSGVCTLNSSSGILTVRDVPDINTQPVDLVKCEGQTAAFSLNATNAFNAYQWQADTGTGFVDLVVNATYTNVTSASLSFTSTVSLNATKYRCRIGMCSILVYSNPVTLTVNTLPTITEQPVDKTICAGESATFTVAATGTGLTYLWQGMVDANTGANTPTLTLTNVKATSSGAKIYCRVSGACTPFVTSAEVTLTVNEVKITTQPVSSVSCVGGTQTFSVVATGTTLTYQWKEDKGAGFVDVANGGIYSNATTANLTLTGLAAAMNNFKYQCVVSGTCAPVTSSTAGLGVISVSKPTIVVNATSNPETPQLTSSVPGSSYQWYKDGAPISGNAQSITVTGPGQYTVKVTINTCTSELSDPQAIIITGDLKTNESSLVTVFPNPGSDRIVFSLGGFEKDKPVSISIVDMQGRVMEKTSGLGQHEVSIDIRNYAGGKYIAWLQQRTTKVARQFIKTDK